MASKASKTCAGGTASLAKRVINGSREQQDRFDRFQRCFNEERPHEALAFATPASVYAAGTRRYPSTIPEPTYSSQFEVRRVRNAGYSKLQGGSVFMSEMLRHELMGLLQIEENRCEVYFGNLLLGEVDTDWMTLTRVR